MYTNNEMLQNVFGSMFGHNKKGSRAEVLLRKDLKIEAKLIPPQQ